MIHSAANLASQMTGTQVKICGLTRIQDARLAQSLGAYALGFVLYPKSPRAITPERLTSLISQLRNEGLRAKTFGVVVNEQLSKVIALVKNCGLNGIQLHGEESPEYCRELNQQLPDTLIYKALPANAPASLITQYPHVDAVLIDTPQGDRVAGGTGLTHDFALSAEICRLSTVPVILAGGLSPENVIEAIESVRPFAIDVSSRIEKSPGIKDDAKLSALFAELKKTGKTHL